MFEIDEVAPLLFKAREKLLAIWSEYWISGIKKTGSNARWSDPLTVYIDEANCGFAMCLVAVVFPSAEEIMMEI